MLTAELATARQYAEALMVDTCTVIDPADVGDRGPIDEDTGQYADSAPPVPVYQGRCKVKVQTVAATTVDAAGQQRVLQRLELHLPVVGSEGVRTGHVATVDTAVHDAALQGRRFRVSGLHHETHATARRLEVVEV